MLFCLAVVRLAAINEDSQVLVTHFQIFLPILELKSNFLNLIILSLHLLLMIYDKSGLLRLVNKNELLELIEELGEFLPRFIVFFQ